MSLKINLNSSSQQETRASVNLPNILNSLRSGPIPFLPDSKWKETLNEQDHYNFILGLREELMYRVFNEIHSNFLENYQVKFVVECAYESLKEIIRLDYFFHDLCNETDSKFCSWHPDQEPETCKPDSWSRGYIEMKKSELQIKPEKEDTVLSDYQLIKLKDYPSENYFDDKPVILPLLKKHESVEELYKCDNTVEQVRSVLNYPFTFTSPASSTTVNYDDIIVNKITSESQIPVRPSDMYFYKRVKRNERERLSIDANMKLKILRARNLPIFNPIEEVKKIILPPLRLPAISSVKRTPVPTVTTEKDKSQNLTKVEFSKENISFYATNPSTEK